jgi:hypothetical protein
LRLGLPLGPLGLQLGCYPLLLGLQLLTLPHFLFQPGLQYFTPMFQ